MQGYENEAAANKKIRVTLDPIQYTEKPDGREAGIITKRMQRNGSTVTTIAEFTEALRQGRTFVGGTYTPNKSADGWGEYRGMQVFALDIDNAREPLDENGEPVKGKMVQLYPGDEGYLDPLEALDRCATLGLTPICLYFTMHASADDNIVRYRIVLDIGLMVDEATATNLIRGLLVAFPEADQTCKWPHHLYYGSNGEVWDCWRTWGGAE